MGGYGSGRRKQHARTDDCLVLDTTWLRKEHLLASQGKRRLTIGWINHTIIDFHKAKERQHKIGAQVTIYGDQGGEFAGWDASGQVDLFYQAEHQERPEQSTFKVSLPLVTTSPNYGGVRWWFLAPCCGRRVRAVYLPTQGELARITPQCRNCLELHYPSQSASYIERQKTYERYLLANYGLYWAAHRYNVELKEHYLEMTPDLWALRMKSVIDWNTHLLKLIIRCDLAIYRSDLANYQSLLSEEDRRIFRDHMQQRERELNTGNLVKTLQQCIAYERLLYEVNTRDMPDNLFALYSTLAQLDQQAKPEQTEPEQEEQKLEQKIVHLETMLKQVNKAERQKKAA